MDVYIRLLVINKIYYSYETRVSYTSDVFFALMAISELSTLLHWIALRYLACPSNQSELPIAPSDRRDQTAEVAPTKISKVVARKWMIVAPRPKIQGKEVPFATIQHPAAHCSQERGNITQDIARRLTKTACSTLNATSRPFSGKAKSSPIKFPMPRTPKKLGNRAETRTRQVN